MATTAMPSFANKRKYKDLFPGEMRSSALDSTHSREASKEQRWLQPLAVFKVQIRDSFRHSNVMHF
jgi:hypothetical protein